LEDGFLPVKEVVLVVAIVDTVSLASTGGDDELSATDGATIISKECNVVIDKAAAGRAPKEPMAASLAEKGE
jgi:hypothetical protein